MPAKSYALKGFLSFLLLWLLSRKSMTGSELSKELQKRKGAKPSPGTIYPALKELSSKGMIKATSGKKYALTPKGKKELNECLNNFFEIFCDIEEMRSCCPKH